MNIGFDAKRAMENTTGLGHYSRTLISSLAAFYPENQYYLYAPRATNLYLTKEEKNITLRTPRHFPGNIFKSWWRSGGLVPDVQKDNLDIYHGLSHEIPAGISGSKIISVVTMHDIIFEIFPHQYKTADRIIYRKKFKYALRHADEIIAISLQTKKDLIRVYGAREDKITVCYQSCDPIYFKNTDEEVRAVVRTKYNLPKKYFLFVGSIIERKNLLQVCQGLALLEEKIPLVVIGNGKAYKKKVQDFIKAQNLGAQVIFLSENSASRALPLSGENFPAIYQMATAFIYPSLYEGFGIPILEALCSGVPVVTTPVSCMPETAGDAALYVEPDDAVGMANAMQQILENPSLANELRRKGFIQAQKFTPQKCAAAVMDVYKKLMHAHR
ncbi:MAG: glycosyltransferase family 1 protein [Ferruginibacter sp.]